MLLFYYYGVAACLCCSCFARASPTPRLLVSLALSAARFARLACCSLRSPPLPLLALLVASPALCLLCPALRSEAVCPACSLRSPPRLCCSRFEGQLACCLLRSPPRLPLASLAAGCWPLRLQLAALAPAGSAHRLTRLLPASPAPAFLHGRQIRLDLPNPLADPLFAPIYLGSYDPPGELPEGEDCVFRRPPVVMPQREHASMAWTGR